MKNGVSHRQHRAPLAMCLGVVLLAASTGCQVEVGGQTLPSPYYLSDDVQYYAPGPEFKLANEAAAQKAFRAEQSLEQPAE